MRRNMIFFGCFVLLSVMFPAIPAGNHFACVLAEDNLLPIDTEKTGTALPAPEESNNPDVSITIDHNGSGTSADMNDISSDVFTSQGNDTPAIPPAAENISPDTEKEEETVIHQPKLILESNNLTSEKIQAGSEREFITCFRNMSRTDAVYNLSVSVRPADESISLKTTSFYFDIVSPQDAIAVSTAACVSPTAEQKKTAVEFSFSYENKEGMAYNSSETAWLETFQPVQASMEGFDLADKVYSMETTTAQLLVRNTGRAPVYNARVVLNAPGLFPTESLFAGTLEAGAAYNGSMKIYIGNKNMESIRQADADTGDGAYGSTTGVLTLSYEDAFGQAYTQTQDFSTYIQEPEIIELTVEKEVETNSWWPAVFAVTLLFFSAALAILAWRLRKSRHQLEDLLLEEKKR